MFLHQFRILNKEKHHLHGTSPILPFLKNRVMRRIYAIYERVLLCNDQFSICFLLSGRV